MKILIFFLIIGLAMNSCRTQQKVSKECTDKAASQAAPQLNVTALAHVFIYKTKKEYSNNVPVTLSDDKTRIVSYPHPSDLIAGDKLVAPTPLHNGYWLDNRGIHKNVAFLKYSYEEYAKLKEVPSLEELLNSIVDKDPLTELWDCGARATFSNMQEQLNKWIDQNLLSEKCKRIK